MLLRELKKGIHGPPPVRWAWSVMILLFVIFWGAVLWGLISLVSWLSG